MSVWIRGILFEMLDQELLPISQISDVKNGKKHKNFYFINPLI